MLDSLTHTPLDYLNVHTGRHLLLLCKPHHDLVDRIQPGAYSPAVLSNWKAAREADGIDALAGLSGLTEDKLAAMIESAVTTMAPQRVTTLDVSGGEHVVGHGGPQYPSRVGRR